MKNSTITNIEYQAKDKSRVNLYIDGEFFMGLPAIVVLENRLKTGQQTDIEALKKLCEDAEREQALSKALGYVARGLKTEKEINDYLFEKEFQSFAVLHAIQKLKEYGYIDDAGYCAAYINTHNKKYGAIKLKYDLIVRGVDERVVSNALSDAGDFTDAAYGVALKYVKDKPLDNTMKAKLKNFLYSRGYGSEVFYSVLSMLNGDGGVDSD